MKILYVSQYFPPEMGAPAARASELARHWVESGHDVTVLTGFPNHPTGEVAPGYRGKIWRGVMREDFHGARVVRTWLWPLPNRKAHERMLNYGSFCVSAALSGSFLSRPDVVIASSPQLLVGPAGWWIAALKRAPFVFEVRDLWPESLAAVGMGREESALYRVLEKVAGFLYRRASRIVVVTPAFKDHLIQHWQVPAEKIAVVENGVETAMFSPEVPGEALRAELLPPSSCAGEPFVVCYVGTMGMAHGLQTLVEAASALQASRPEVQFLLVGEGADRERLQGMIAERGLTNLRLLGQQPRERIPAYIRASDAALVLLRKAELFRTVIPTKMLEFMACARPTIVGVEGEARRITQESGGGLCIEPENAAQLVEAILRLKADRSLRDALGARGRDYIEREFSRRAKAQDYLRILAAMGRE